MVVYLEFSRVEKSVEMKVELKVAKLVEQMVDQLECQRVELLVGLLVGWMVLRTVQQKAAAWDALLESCLAVKKGRD
jgi:hypothetical protein